MVANFVGLHIGCSESWGGASIILVFKLCEVVETIELNCALRLLRKIRFSFNS